MGKIGDPVKGFMGGSLVLLRDMGWGQFGIET